MRAYTGYKSKESKAAKNLLYIIELVNTNSVLEEEKENLIKERDELKLEIVALNQKLNSQSKA